MKKLILPISQIIINLLCIPLYFLKLIKYVATLPSQDGGVNSYNVYFSPYENLKGDELNWLFYTSLALILSSIIISVFSIIIKDSVKLKKIGLIVSIISVVFTAFVILRSSDVARGF